MTSFRDHRVNHFRSQELCMKCTMLQQCSHRYRTGLAPSICMLPLQHAKQTVSFLLPLLEQAVLDGTLDLSFLATSCRGAGPICPMPALPDEKAIYFVRSQLLSLKANKEGQMKVRKLGSGFPPRIPPVCFPSHCLEVYARWRGLTWVPPVCRRNGC